MVKCQLKDKMLQFPHSLPQYMHLDVSMLPSPSVGLAAICHTHLTALWDTILQGLRDVTSATLPPLTDPQFSSELTREDCHWAKEGC